MTVCTNHVLDDFLRYAVCHIGTVACFFLNSFADLNKLIQSHIILDRNTCRICYCLVVQQGRCVNANGYGIKLSVYLTGI